MIIISKFFQSSKSQVLWLWEETIPVTNQSQTIFSEYNKSLVILQKSGSRKVSALFFLFIKYLFIVKVKWVV